MRRKIVVGSYAVLCFGAALLIYGGAIGLAFAMSYPPLSWINSGWAFVYVAFPVLMVVIGTGMWVKGKIEGGRAPTPVPTSHTHSE